MSQKDQKLAEIIKSIEKNANPKNMKIIYKELSSLSNNITKLKKNLAEACKLINLISIFLVKGEGLDTTESQLIFDTFCDLDFMSILVKYSSFDIYEINLEIINTFSFLMINIKSNTYLYYFFSNNLLNKIINKDYSKYDQEFLSYYVNFLKTLSLRLDDVSVQLFYIEKANNFPIIENATKLFNHKDSMVRNVVRNIVLNILKINYPKIQDHFTQLPSISYLANIACHLRDICFQINDEVSKNKTSDLQYLYDDLIDEASYIDDVLNLNLPKINYIVINCLFYYLIMPIICGAISEKTKKISKKVALFLIIFFFLFMKNEIFKNCLFALLFFDQLTSDLDYFFEIPPEKNNYSFYLDNKKKIPFWQFISENYSHKFLLTMIQDDNIIYNKYKDKYPEIETIMQKCKGMYKKIMTSKNNVDLEERFEMIINGLFTEEEGNIMSQYHNHLCMSTGLGIGQFAKESTGEIYNICFLCYINQIFIDLKGNQKGNNSSNLNYTNNIVKEGLYKIIQDLDEKNTEMILLINILIFVVQNKEVNISNNLLRHVGMENIKEKIVVKESLMKNIFNYFGNKKIDDESPLSELCFSNNNFNFINDYFLITKDPKNLLLNNIKLPLILSKHLLIRYKNNLNNDKEDKKGEEKEKEEKKEEEKQNENKEINAIKNKDNKNIIQMNPFLLPITYKLILFNIINLSFNSSNAFELKKDRKNFTLFKSNIDNLYNQVLKEIYGLIKKNEIFREEGYNIFYKNWKIYNKKYNNKNTFDLIRDEIMKNTFLLLPEEYEKTNEEEYPNEISMKHANKLDNYFSNLILLYMMLHDLKEMLIISKNINKLIKNDFPLSNNRNDMIELKNNEDFNLEKINKKNIFRTKIFFKLYETEEFKEGELIIYNNYLYFTTIMKDNLVKTIDFKLKLTSVSMYKNFHENVIINFLITNKDDDCLNEKSKLKNQKDLNIIVKFEDEKKRDETIQYYNDKIVSINNIERSAFNEYFKEKCQGDNIN